MHPIGLEWGPDRRQRLRDAISWIACRRYSVTRCWATLEVTEEKRLIEQMNRIKEGGPPSLTSIDIQASIFDFQSTVFCSLASALRWDEQVPPS